MMSLLFITTRGFYPEAVSGAQLSAMAIFNCLRASGWRIEVISVLAAHTRHGDNCEVSYAPYWRRDTLPGYPCYRSLRRPSHLKALIADRIAAFSPSIVIGGHDADVLPYLDHSLELGIPTCYFARCIDPLPAGFRFSRGLHVLTNSPVGARHLAQFSETEVTVIRSSVRVQMFQDLCGDRRFITFVNPIPEKGLDIAVAVARLLPEAEFLFVRGKWSTYVGGGDTLEQCAGPKNVTTIGFQEDMRPIYSSTRILFVPSQFQDTAPRVIVEANASGIPVVASSVCGIPDQLGKGGVLVDPKDDVEQYTAALRLLLEDPILYARLSTLARENSRRPEFSQDNHFAILQDFLSKVCREPVGAP